MVIPIKSWLPVFIVLLFFNVVLINFWHQKSDYPTGDASHYYNLSSAAAPDEHTSPFVYRRLSPWLVHKMDAVDHGGLTFNWGLLTVIVLALTQTAFYFICRRAFHFSQFTSVLGVFLLASSYGFTLFHYQSIWLVDPLNNFFTVLALGALFTRRYLAFVVVLLVGSINKEVILMLAPLYPLDIWLQSRTVKARPFMLSLLSLVGLAVVFVLYRHWLNARLGIVATANPLAGSYGSFSENLSAMSKASHPSIFSDWFAVFYLLWPMLGYAWYRLVQAQGNLTRLGVVGVYWLVVLTLSSYLAADMTRILAWAAPIVIITILAVLDEVPDRGRPILFLLAVTFAALNSGWFPDKTLATAANLVLLGLVLPLMQAPHANSKTSRLITI